MDWRDYSFVRRSGLRMAMLRSLAEREKTPSQLKSELKISISLASRYLTQLRKRGLIKALTGNETMWKIYAVTTKGHALIEKIRNE